MMKRYYRLSYIIEKKTPLYPGTPAVCINKVKDKNKGESCNTYQINFSNHTGTHIDAPYHFFNSGRRINNYSLEELLFQNPLLVDCPQEIDGCIKTEDLAPHIRSSNFDILLIRTGFFKYRNKKNKIYSYKNPYILPMTARWLRSTYPSLKAIGIDCISVSSYLHKELGRQAHRIFLKEDKFKKSSVLILEDMYIPYKIKKIDKVMVLPILVKGLDSAPCTVIALSDD